MTEIKRDTLADIAAQRNENYKLANWRWANVTGTNVKNLSSTERDEVLAELKKGPPRQPQPMPEKHARAMSEQERAEWLSEHKRRWR
jgi:hypothetical protein